MRCGFHAIFVGEKNWVHRARIRRENGKVCVPNVPWSERKCVSKLLPQLANSLILSDRCYASQLCPMNFKLPFEFRIGIAARRGEDGGEIDSFLDTDLCRKFSMVFRGKSNFSVEIWTCYFKNRNIV